MKNTLLAIIAFLILGGSSCEKLVDHVYRIRIQNNSEDTIQFYDSYLYPDTSMAINKPPLKTIFPSKYFYLDSKEKWENILPKDTIQIFIFNKDTVDSYTWDEIRNEYKILERLTYSLTDLESQEWTMTYP